ncbi:MAG TPA: DUF3024 domain-containing protein [Egibacteraceae bacterium]|nr:DUF3024 domain-containing protein [Actinomycetota bacterium]HWB72687.1 DUF3024 domain-containing protein [Egibacteraceae bacterium]
MRVEVEVSDRAITIVERRAPWREDLAPEWTRSPVARLRYTRSRSEWTLYWRDRNQRFHRYDGAPPTPDIDTLITAIDEDATGIFWG